MQGLYPIVRRVRRPLINPNNATIIAPAAANAAETAVMPPQQGKAAVEGGSVVAEPKRAQRGNTGGVRV